ncbi:MAG: MlaD family protein, partial [Cyclobacteriaceae bacterium]
MKVSKEFKVGLLALVSITILYIGFNFLKGINFFNPNNTYYAIYNNIDGLQEANPVVLNGLSVGRVSEIEILQNLNNRIRVAIDVDNDLQLASGTVAMIKSDLLGGMAIHLDSVKSGNPITSGDTLIARLNQGMAAQLTSTALPVVDKLELTLVNLNRVLDNLNNQKEGINSIIGNFKTTSANLATGTSQIQGLTQALDNVLAQISNDSTGISPLMSKFNGLAGAIDPKELEATLVQTKGAIENLNNVLAQVSEGNGSLGKLLKDEALYNKLAQSSKDLDRLLVDMRENPRRYVHFSVFGRKD